MYINKKILIFIFSFLFVIISTVYATNTINWLTDAVTEGDIISATYYNNLNWSKSDWWICRYSWDKLVCLDDWVSIYKDIVPLSEIKKFHDWCENGASYFYYCNSAAHRYCTDACAVSWWDNCAGWVSGLDYDSWFMNEIDSTQIVVTCIKG